MRVPYRFEFVTDAPSGATVSIDAGIRSPDALFAALADALRFPDYFGQNWDALFDCLSDLSWREDPEIVLDHPALPALPDDALLTYVTCLADALERRPLDLAPRLRPTFRGADADRVARLLADAAPVVGPTPLSFHDASITRFERAGDDLLLDIDHALAVDTLHTAGATDDGTLALVRATALRENGADVRAPTMPFDDGEILDLSFDSSRVRLLVQWRRNPSRSRDFADYQIHCANVTWTSRTDTLDLAHALDRLLADWDGKGVALRPGVAASALQAFAARNALTAPSAFADLYGRVDGMADAAMDRHQVHFWPLEDVRPVGSCFPGIAFAPRDDYFVFADYAIETDAYAVRLRGGPDDVVLINDTKCVPLAPSFRTFLQRYASAP